MFERVAVEDELLLARSIFWFLKRVELGYEAGHDAYRCVLRHLDDESSVRVLLYGLYGYYEFDAVFREACRPAVLWVTFEGGL